MSQWYAYFPGDLIVIVPFAPPARSPVSKDLSSAVRVWATPSWFVTAVVVPGATCNVVGENAKFEMTMLVPFGLAADAAPEPGASVTARVMTAATTAITGTIAASTPTRARVLMTGPCRSGQGRLRRGPRGPSGPSNAGRGRRACGRASPG